MEIFETNSLVVLVAVIGLGVVLAPVVQVAWTMKILIASYIALCLVLLMPENFAFNMWASSIYFGIITILFVFVEQGRLFDVSEWSASRFSLCVFGLSVLLWVFLAAIVCLLTPFSLVDFFMTEPVYAFLTDYIFYFAVAPLVFAVLFSRNLR